VEKVVGEMWEERWRDKRVSRGLPLATQISPLQSQCNGFKGHRPPPLHKMGEACRYLPWGGGGWGNKQDVFLVAAATVIFVVFAYKNYVAQ